MSRAPIIFFVVLISHLLQFYLTILHHLCLGALIRLFEICCLTRKRGRQIRVTDSFVADGGDGAGAQRGDRCGVIDFTGDRTAVLFFESKKNQRIILMTTKASTSYTKFKFDKNDTILFGRESAGVPENIHKLVKFRLKIPMKDNKRSLNIASSVSIILAESLKQTKLI